MFDLRTISKYCCWILLAISLIFWGVDVNLYPAYKFQFLAVRLAVFVFFSIVLFFIPRVKEKTLTFLMMTGLFLACVGVSSTSIITGDGFKSTYFIAIIQIIMVSSIFVRYSIRQYVLFIILVLAEHFTINAFVPCEMKYLMMQIFGLAGTAFIAIVIHNILYTLFKKVQTLEGLIPICAVCKNIRDDKGYWHKVENYIKDRSPVEFTHGLCPQCLEQTKKYVRKNHSVENNKNGDG